MVLEAGSDSGGSTDIGLAITGQLATVARVCTYERHRHRHQRPSA